MKKLSMLSAAAAVGALWATQGAQAAVIDTGMVITQMDGSTVIDPVAGAYHFNVGDQFLVWTTVTETSPWLTTTSTSRTTTTRNKPLGVASLSYNLVSSGTVPTAAKPDKTGDVPPQWANYNITGTVGDNGDTYPFVNVNLVGGLDQPTGSGFGSGVVTTGTSNSTMQKVQYGIATANGSLDLSNLQISAGSYTAGLAGTMTLSTVVTSSGVFKESTAAAPTGSSTLQIVSPDTVNGSSITIVVAGATAASQIQMGQLLAGTTNIATGGSVQITKFTTGQYASEVDDLTSNVNKGGAAIGPTAINGSEGPVYVMLWLNDTDTNNASTITSLLTDLGAAGGTTYSVLASGDPKWTELQGMPAYGGFNGLIKFNSPVADTSNFSWDFANNTDIVVDKLAVVPEPATLGLIGIGALGLVARRRKAR